MIEFLDGPATGAKLNLKRTPVFLRVVMDQERQVDALDLPDDKPRAGERIYAYRIVDGTVITGFLCGLKGKGCLQFRSALYKLCDTQPSIGTMVDHDKWVAWCIDKHDLAAEVKIRDR